ncbi:MAG: 30S ribosomal protein S2 [Alphaproteobacteria bacterium]|nr:30S ribosomal protein S2 [Alphaproteobacteria bacterium]
MPQNQPIIDFSLKQLMQAGVHFGHTTRKWDPKMAPYIYGVRSGVHIINLETTAPLLRKALEKVYEVAKNNGKILFVGTKRQAQEVVKKAATRSGQHYVNHRWLGGCITNWDTVSRSITTLKDLRKQLESADETGLTKKELLMLSRKRDKMELVLGGIDELNGTPDLVFVLDACRDDIAIKESNIKGIPVVAILDTNASPDSIDFPVPGNDDVIRAIRLYCDLMVEAILKGTEAAYSESGADIGAASELPDEAALGVDTPSA